jgi:hypothetical protein
MNKHTISGMGQNQGQTSQWETILPSRTWRLGVSSGGCLVGSKARSISSGEVKYLRPDEMGGNRRPRQVEKS